MTVSAIITVLVGVASSAGFGAAITALVNARRNSSMSETEARAQFTSEFNAIVAWQNTQIDQLRAEVKTLGVQVTAVRNDHAEAEKYIDLILTGIANGTVPPIPDRGVR